MRRHASRARTRVGAIALVCALLAGCADAFTPGSVIESLRVLAVRGEPAFAKPGGEVELEILYHDGSPRAVGADGKPRPIQIAWFGGCHNPPGDVFYSCIPQLAKTFAALGSGAPPEPGSFGIGPKFTATFPADVISSREPPPPPQIPYGRSFVFFAACAGEVRPSPDRTSSADALPIVCVDSAGNEVGPDDFVVGYFPISTYETLTNENPIVTGLVLDGKQPSNAACEKDAECSGGERCSKAGACIPVIDHCTRSIVDDCPEHALVPTVDRASAEPDPAAATADGEVPEESIWADYFTTEGRVAKETKIVNDSKKGWADDFGSGLKAPLEGNREVRVWVVVHDNRGGGAWVAQDVFVR